MRISRKEIFWDWEDKLWDINWFGYKCVHFKSQPYIERYVDLSEAYQRTTRLGMNPGPIVLA